jgi:hypothetical protein
MRVIDTMGVQAAFALWCLAGRNVPDTSPARGVHPGGVLVGSTFGLVQLLDDLLSRTTDVRIPDTSTTGCVSRLAGSGTRLRVGRRVGHVASATTAGRMHTNVVGIINGSNEFAIITATTYFGSNRG